MTAAMSLYTLGLNHQTAPLDVREQVVFSPDALGHALRDLLTRPKVKEAAILSTCNRTELYVNTPAPEDVTQWLADFHHIERRELAPYLYALPREKAKTLTSDSTPRTLTVTEVDGNASSSRDTSFRSPGP